MSGLMKDLNFFQRSSKKNINEVGFLSLEQRTSARSRGLGRAFIIDWISQYYTLAGGVGGRHGLKT